MLGDIYTYFRDYMDGLGYKEHDDGFNILNLGNNIFDGAYHIDVSPATGVAPNMDQDAQKTQNNVVLRVYKDGYNRVQDAKQEALNEASIIMATLLVSRNRLTNTENILDIKLSNYSITPLAGDADHSFVVEFNFSVEYYLDFVEILNL